MKNLLLVPSILALSACGGGSGGGIPLADDSSSSPKASAQFDAGSINSDIKAIGEAYGSSFTAVDATIQSLLVAATVSSSSSVKSVISKHNGLQVNSSKSCNDDTGSIDINHQDNDNNTNITGGDVVTLTASNCKLGTSISTNGKIVLSLKSFGSIQNVEGTITLTDFVVIDSDFNEDLTLNGELSFAYTTDFSTNVAIDKVTYNNFSFKNNTSGATGTIISGNTKDTFSTTSAEEFTDTFEITDVFANIPELDGIVKIYTNPALSGKSNLDYYTSGILFYEGANESSIQINAGSGTSLAQAKVTLTLNGSTITQTMNWDEL